MTDLDVLRRNDGGFAMLALDQRESMRDLLVGDRDDPALRAFKEQASDALAPYASAVLLDRLYGVGDEPPAWTATTPLILAADAFTQESGKPVEASVLDPAVTPDVVARVGAAALKFLALWHRGDGVAARDDLARAFVDLARRSGVPAVLEGIVRPGVTGWRDPADRDDAIVEAAADFARAGANLYKAEVPGDARRPETVEARSREVSDALGGRPWVVLSNGVDPELFPDAVAAACAGGASGFLAGRAVWTTAARSADPAAALRDDAVRRFARIADRVSLATVR